MQSPVCIYCLPILAYKLKKAYEDENDPKIELLVKSLRALAFVPVEEVEACYLAIINSTLYDSRLDDFLEKYFIVS